MDIINDIKTYNKINLYKNNINKFIETQNDENIYIQIKNIDTIDYIIGILFLTEMNRYCKINKISIHGYYIAYAFINLFNKIKSKLYYNILINNEIINIFWINFFKNIEYFYQRVDNSNLIKNKIKENLCKFVIEYNKILFKIINFHKKHLFENNLDLENTIYCDIKCYTCWTKEILSNFIFLILITAKFIGSGEFKDPNLIKLSEYYSRIIFVYLKFNSSEIINNNIKLDLFNIFLENKDKLNDSLKEINYLSNTIQEIIIFLNESIKLFTSKIN